MRNWIDLFESGIAPASRKWVNGRCADMALAILSLMPEEEARRATIVAVGKSLSGFGHIGILLDGGYLDARGALSAEEFVQPFGYPAGAIEKISLQEVEAECGLTEVPFPYLEIEEIDEAREAAEDIFPQWENRHAPEPLVTSDYLKTLRGDLAKVAQEEYDAWQLNDEGYDEVVGLGGICHLIADRMVEVLNQHDIESTSVSSTHEVHVYVVARLEDGIFEIDIPYSTYETGGGYNWKKIEGVTFTADDVVINRLSIDKNDFDDYAADW